MKPWIAVCLCENPSSLRAAEETKQIPGYRASRCGLLQNPSQRYLGALGCQQMALFLARKPSAESLHPRSTTILPQKS